MEDGASGCRGSFLVIMASVFSMHWITGDVFIICFLQLVFGGFLTFFYGAYYLHLFIYVWAHREIS